MKKVVPTKASLLNMEYPKPVSPSGAENLTKNAKPKPSPNEMELMKENLRLRKELEEAKKENLF